MLSLIHAGFECSDHCRKSYAGYVCFLQCHYLHSYKSCENDKYTIFHFDLLICQAHGFVSLHVEMHYTKCPIFAKLAQPLTRLVN